MGPGLAEERPWRLVGARSLAGLCSSHSSDSLGSGKEVGVGVREEESCSPGKPVVAFHV